MGICDLDVHKLEATASRFGVEATFINTHEMLDRTRPDAVYALMPPHVLFDVALDVLERGHHLFIEKPPGVTTQQTKSMARVAARNDLVTAVGFQRRYHPMVQACWKMVRETGDVHDVVVTFYKNVPPQDDHPYYRGAIDILRCDAIHAVDALRYYAGLPDVRDVASEVRMLDSWYDVSFNSLVHFENDSVGVLLVNWRTGRRVFRFEFHACGASAYVDADGVGTVWRDNRAEPDFSSSYQEYVGCSEPWEHQGFLAENRAFIDAVREGEQVHNSLQDAVKTMALADMIYQNAINREDGYGQVETI